MIIKKTICLTLLLFVIILTSCEQKKKTVFVESDLKIIPEPVELKLEQGSFIFDKETKFVVADKEQKELAQSFINRFKTVSGWDMEIVNKKPNQNYIQFITDKKLGNEAYKLKVTDNGVDISANGFSGFFYGTETIRQLLPIEIESKDKIENINWEIPNVEINDAPRFRWRGMMLDVSRHFFNKE